jgi:hypothetical protein
MPAKQPRRSASGEARDIEREFKKRIELSSLDAKCVKRLDLKICMNGTVPRELREKAPGFVIPYFDTSGRKTKFFRYRYLAQPPRNGFDALTKKKPLRYAQPPNTVNELYLPPLVDWKKVAKDKTLPILMTEGEMKAACGTLNTPYPTIGLGGVWCWKSAKARQPMLEQFDEFDWDGRPVYIVYDSDAKTNPMVIQAENALAQALTARGAEPHVSRLPPLADGAKCGLDDYLLEHDVEDLEELLESSEPWRAAKELHQLNEEVIYVQDPGFVVRVDTLQKMSPQAFISHHYAPRVFWEEQVSAQGKVTMVKKSAPKEWIAWPSRAEVRGMTYAPGLDRITEHGKLNVWPGWACEPQAGDVSLWTQLLDHLFSGHPEERKWIEQWLAWPLQHPGDKMYTYVLMWGLRHGTGKSLIGYSMKQIYGSNWTEIKNKHLEAGHNEWAENKQFVMGDELMIGDKRGMGDQVKGLVTQEDMRINVKYIPSYVVPDLINYYFTSNHPDSFFLEDDDRRAWVYEVTCNPMEDSFYAKYERWMRADKYDNAKGPSALFHHLLNVDTSDFNPRARAPMTSAKREMVQTGRSDLGDWVHRLKEDPDSVLRMGTEVVKFALWRAEDLLRLFDPEARSRVTANGLSRELKRQGFVKAAGGAPLRTKQDGQLRAWIVRPTPRYIEDNQTDAAEWYDKERAMPVVKRSKLK